MSNLVPRRISKSSFKRYKKFFEIYINKKLMQLLQINEAKHVYKIISKVNRRFKRIEIFLKKFRRCKYLTTLKSKIKSKFKEFLLIAILLLKMLNFNFENSEFLNYKFNFQQTAQPEIKLLVRKVSSSFDKKTIYFNYKSPIVNARPLTIGDLGRPIYKYKILPIQKFLDHLDRITSSYIETEPSLPKTWKEWEIYENEIEKRFQTYVQENLKALREFEQELQKLKQKLRQRYLNKKHRRERLASFSERTKTLQDLPSIENPKASLFLIENQIEKLYQKFLNDVNSNLDNRSAANKNSDKKLKQHKRLRSRVRQFASLEKELNEERDREFTKFLSKEETKKVKETCQLKLDELENYSIDITSNFSTDNFFIDRTAFEEMDKILTNNLLIIDWK